MKLGLEILKWRLRSPLGNVWIRVCPGGWKVRMRIWQGKKKFSRWLLSFWTKSRVSCISELYHHVSGGTSRWRKQEMVIFCWGWRLRECWNGMKRWSKSWRKYCYSEFSAGAAGWGGWWYVGRQTSCSQQIIDDFGKKNLPSWLKHRYHWCQGPIDGHGHPGAFDRETGCGKQNLVWHP